MEQYNVTGMSCAACQSRVEKAVAALPGVSACSVSLLTNSMGVEGEASSKDVIAAVTKAGYRASLKDTNKANEETDFKNSIDKEISKLKNRLIWSVIFLIVLMYFSMGHSMLGLPLPKYFHSNPIALAIIQMLLTLAVMLINQKFFINGAKSIIHRSLNMDTLVSMGSGVSFAYSVVVLFAMSDALANGNLEAANSHLHDLYFETSAMILTLITVGKTLESKAKGKTTSALKGLMDLSPKMATIKRDGLEYLVSVKEVKVGDIFIVKPGESIPVDGTIIEGSSAINESALTGESIPVDKEAGDNVSAATINQSGYIVCEAVRVGEDTTLSQIIKMVSDAAATKAPIAKIADKVSGIFVPVVVLIAVVTTVVWLLAGQSFGDAISLGIAVLVISCPCALGLATPVAIMVGNGVGAKAGILFKTAQSLENTSKVQIIALDKTGTITEGKPVVTDVVCEDNINIKALLENAYSLEVKSEHPLAKAVVEYGKEQKIIQKQVMDFKAAPGNGLSGIIDNEMVLGGNLKYISSKVQIDEKIKEQISQLSKNGKTPLCFAKNESFLGAIAVSDTIKPDSKAAVLELKNMGIRVVMLTGDNELTAKAIGKHAGVDEVIAGVMPDGKEAVIKKLQEEGRVAMVGDGINDAPALTRADIGIAIGAGTDVAIDAADIVLMKSRLMDVTKAIKLSSATLKNIKENLFWAFFYNIIGIPLAAGLLIPIFGIKLNPMFGAAAMSLSSVCVVTNALRLNMVKLSNKNKDIKNTEDNKNIKTLKEVKEKENMEKTIKIEGMMCGHCEANVKKRLEALDGVTNALVSHEAGNAIVTMEKEISLETLTNAIEGPEKDYKVVK